MSVHIAVVSFELHLPGARSLKEKRRTVRSLVDRIHARCRVSVAETGFQELHQRSEISVAAVTSDALDLERKLDDVRRLAEDSAEALLLRWEPRWIDGHAESEAAGWSDNPWDGDGAGDWSTSGAGEPDDD
ncbi:MAG: DUF503 domain-containing protein [Acidobacteriota bacterium]